MTTLPAGWKPISSAPKDGTEFLARWGRQGGSVEIVNWNRIHGHFASKGHALLGFESNATHWTPLPQFPGTHDAPITVSLDPDPRGVSVGVWQGSHCIYTGAHAVPVAPLDAQDEQVRHKMNADLCAFYMRWEADGDYLRCRKCKRPQIASYAEKGFPHAAGCKAVGNVEQRPWLALIELMRPLIGSAAPAAGDARDAERLDFLANHGAYVAWSKDRECCAVFLRDNEGNSGPMTKWGENWLTAREAIDAAIAAQVPQQGEA